MTVEGAKRLLAALQGEGFRAHMAFGDVNKLGMDNALVMLVQPYCINRAEEA